MDELNRILHVEDDPDIQAVARLALERLGGFRVMTCASGPEALSAAPGFAPQMVLLDVMMPGMDGPSTLKGLRALPATAAVPVAFMTAKVQPTELAGLMALGVAGVIEKPFDPMTLAQKVREIWERAAG